MKKMFNYEVTTYAEGNEIVLRTNSIDDALSAIFQCAEDGLHANIINGHTGEVLAIVNHPNGEDFATDEMALMMVGFLASKNWGEPEEDEPACHYCGGPVNANGVCQHCGVEDDTLRAEPEEIEPDDLFAFLEQMVAEGKAVKLGGLPS